MVQGNSSFISRLLYSDQYGLRQLHSVFACLLKCTNDWCLNIDRGNFTAMIFIDLRKAFDKADYHNLLDKVQRYEIDSLEYECFSSYLHNRKQCCRVNGGTLDSIVINIGIPQGPCLGPFLFFLYINDLPFSLSKAYATMYAYATAVLFSSDKIEEINTVVNTELACL